MSEGSRGSRKHVLDWVKHPKFAAQMNKMLAGTGALVDDSTGRWMPNATDGTEALLDEDPGRRLLPEPGCGDTLGDWWLKNRDGANVPNWDIAAACTVKNAPGLVLVEAKAHEGELDWGPKKVSPKTNQENHERIGTCIADAGRDLRRALGTRDVRISRDEHYQLSNRITFAWKLASMGVPVVLVYLGFTGDTYFKNDYLRDANHWQRVMGGYMQGLFPLSAVGVEVPCGKSSFKLLIESRAVEPSR